MLNDLGLVGFREPFARLFIQGMIDSGAPRCPSRRATSSGPTTFVERYGADAVRLYILFIGPADQDMEWTDDGIEGIAASSAGSGGSRTSRRRAPAGEPERRAARAQGARAIAKVTDDIGRRFAFNTAIAAVMELVNEISKDTRRAGMPASRPRRRCR